MTERLTDKNPCRGCKHPAYYCDRCEDYNSCAAVQGRRNSVCSSAELERVEYRHKEILICYDRKVWHNSFSYERRSRKSIKGN